MDPNTWGIAGILSSIVTLLIWVVHRVVKESEAKTVYIEKLVEINQKNSDSFLGAINHQQTANRDMQAKTNDTLRELTTSLNQQNIANRALIDFLRVRD